MKYGNGPPEKKKPHSDATERGDAGQQVLTSYDDVSITDKRKKVNAMTYEEILKTDKPFLTPSDVAEVLGCKPYSVNLQAREDIGKLGFPASLIGTRVRIPRLGFINWITGGNNDDGLRDSKTAE